MVFKFDFGVSRARMHTRVGRRTLARIKLDVHPSAHVHPSASLAHGVVIGPRAYVGPRAVLDAHVTAGADVAIGEATRVGAHTSLEHCTVGRRCVIHAGVRVGADGFGFALPDVPGQQPSKRPQMLRVLIGDDVELGAGTCVDRGSWRHTELGAGCKLDNQVQIGHNARLGTGCILCAQSAVAGSATLGDGCVLAGKVVVMPRIPPHTHARTSPHPSLYALRLPCPITCKSSPGCDSPHAPQQCPAFARREITVACRRGLYAHGSMRWQRGGPSLLSGQSGAERRGGDAHERAACQCAPCRRGSLDQRVPEIPRVPRITKCD